MSAQIPDTLLVSEVLKPTGFDCPEDLEGVPFNEAVSGSTSAVLEDNKEVSITENGTIEITPTAGHDYAGMKKVTANVNVAGGADIEANKAATINVSTYTEPVEITPTAGKDGMAKATVTLSNIPSPSGGGELRYFDGRNSGYAANPRGFWVIGKNQTSGKACCLVLGPLGDVPSSLASYVQTIQSVTGNRLSIDDMGRESFLEVSADIVAQAIANSN